MAAERAQVTFRAAIELSARVNDGTIPGIFAARASPLREGNLSRGMRIRGL
jgi:hypothetical protein